MKNRLVLAAALLLAGCSPAEPDTPGIDGDLRFRPTPSPETPAPDRDLSGATRVEAWATRYFAAELEHKAGGIPLRDMQGHLLGPRLSPEDWCTAAMEGTAIIDGEVYNWAGTTGYSQADCAYDPSELVRFSRVSAPYGLGVENRPLQPFRSLACDIGRAQGSFPWLNGGHAYVGQEVYIPAAVGAKLPDGSTHDGMFVCEDMGEAITGNHVDVFVGPVPGGDTEAAKVDPFNFVHSMPSGTFDAYFFH